MTDRISLLYNERKYKDALKKGITYLRNAKVNSKQYYAVHNILGDIIDRDLTLVKLNTKGNDEICILQGHKYLKDGNREQAIKCYDIDNGIALYHLGLLYEKNEYKAFQYFKKSSEKGNRYALYSMGNYYKTKYRYDEAVEYYEKSAKQGYKKAFYSLGYMYEHGTGVYLDLEKAIEYYRESDSIEAKRRLGWVYYKNKDRTGEITVYNYNKQLEDGDYKNECIAAIFDKDENLVEILATKDNPMALWYIGMRLIENERINEGTNMFKKSIELGFNEANSTLGDLLYSRNQNAKAIFFYKMAYKNNAILNHELIAYKLYSIKEYTLAKQIFTKIGDCEGAAEKLCMIYMKGLGTHQDHWKALECLKRHTVKKYYYIPKSNYNNKYEPLYLLAYKAMYDFHLKYLNRDILRPNFYNIKRYCENLQDYENPRTNKGRNKVKPKFYLESRYMDTVIDYALEYRKKRRIKIKEGLNKTCIYTDIQGVVLNYI
jgi:TPR repeat protein